MSKMGWFGGSYGRLRSPEIAPIDRAFIRVPISVRFSRLGISTCDGQAGRRTGRHTMTAYTALP